MKTQIALLILPLVLAACSSQPKDVSNAAQGGTKPTTQASMEAKQLAAEQESPYVTEIEFNKGSSQITPAARLKLERLLSQAQNNENIEGIKVVSWADQDYPSERQSELSQSQKELAEKRNDEIEKFVKRINDDLNVDSLSMAERPGELAKFLRTENARMKESLETSGIALSGGTTGSNQANVQSKASKAIVMLELKDNAD